MSSRDEDKRLKELRDNGKTIYSISRIDCINHCLYEAYLTYKKGIRGSQNIYSLMGGRIHETLEDITNGKATEEDLLIAMNKELEDADLCGFEFPKMADGSDIIRQGWITDMTHFCNTYKAPKGEFSTEELFIYKTKDDNYLQGYIDLQKKNKNGTISIYDYKTSTMYKGEALKEHGRQLCIYLMGLEQLGYKVDKVAWIFLKYVTIKFMGYKTSKSKTKTEIIKYVERKKIASEMSKYIEKDLFDLGYDEIDTDVILDKFKKTNTFDCLPEEIRAGYKMTPCVYEYEITDEVKQECEAYIDETIKMWESLGDDEKSYIPLNFTKTTKSGKVTRDDFYCSQLCGHSDKCPHHKDFLDKWSEESEDEDLF